MTYLDQELLETRESEQPAPYEELEAKEAAVFCSESWHASAAPAGSAATQISKRPQLPGDQRNHGVIRQQRRRAHSQRPENSAAALRAGLQGIPAVHSSNSLMKINLDDPNLTAFALGELSGTDRPRWRQRSLRLPKRRNSWPKRNSLSGNLRNRNTRRTRYARDCRGAR